MKIEFSIVIPTYNRSMQLLLTLIGFKNQIFPHNQFEVIVVDDCSTDNTEEIIKNIYTPFRLIYEKMSERKGPAHARNIGIYKSNGEFIIFCDADFIVLPNFLKEIQKYHFYYRNSVVSCTPGCYKTVYTHYYQEFSNNEKDYLQYILSESKINSVKNFKSNEIIELITCDELESNFNSIYKFVGWEIISPDLKREYLQTDVAPWLLFITRCVSVQKKFLEEVGGFDENLIRGAGEDWELGYRLYKLGLPFIGIEENLGFHQEHPSSYRIPYKDYKPFSKILIEKFGMEDPELLLLLLWKSSDDLWSDVGIYKKLLRMVKNINKLSNEQQILINFLLRACRLQIENN